MGKLASTIRLLVPPAAAFFIAGISDSGTFIEATSSLGGVALLVPIFVEFFKSIFDFKDKVIWGIKAARAVSWFFSILLSVVSYIAGWGYFGELTAWYMPVIAGLGVGLVSNGYFTIEMVQELLKIIFENLKSKRNEETNEKEVE